MLSALLVAASAGLVLPPLYLASAQRQPSCTTITYAMDLRTCFNSYMDRTVMIHDMATIVETSLQAEGFLDDPSNICKQKSTFTNLFDCLSGTTTKCITQDTEMKYLPNATLTQQGLDYFCRHLDDIDKSCYNDSYREVFSCVKKLSTDNLKSNDTDATRACTTVDITYDCIYANVLCDETTRNILLKFQGEYRKPNGCPAPARSDRKKYITTGRGATVLVSKLFCFIFNMFFILLIQTI